MKKNTRFAFNAYLQQLARLNGVAVEELSSKFTVSRLCSRRWKTRSSSPPLS